MMQGKTILSASTKYIFLLIFLSGFLTSDIISQNKFEFSLSVDPIVAPINFLTYVEDGPGYYDIHGKVGITHAGAVYFNYWPFRNIGFAIGEGIRTFRSEIDYAIPEPVGPGLKPVFEGSNPFRAIGWGPSLGILWRMEKWKARIGFGIFELYDLKFTPSSSISSVVIGEAGGEIIAHLQLEEEAYWRNVPYSYGFLQNFRRLIKILFPIWELSLSL